MADQFEEKVNKFVDKAAKTIEKGGKGLLEKLDIEKPGKGIIFVQEVSKVYGLAK